MINWFNIKHAVCGVVENLDNKDMAYGLFKNDIIKQFIKNYSYYISTAEKLLKYETNLIETYGTSLVNSPVYRFSIQFDVKNVVERLKKLYCIYAPGGDSINTSLSDNKMICEGDDKPEKIMKLWLILNMMLTRKLNLKRLKIHLHKKLVNFKLVTN